MELNLLFLPFLGGYIFYSWFSLTAYHAARDTGQRLVFHSAAYGLVFLIIARLLTSLVPNLADGIGHPIIGAAGLFIAGSGIALFGALCLVCIQTGIDGDLRLRLNRARFTFGLVLGALAIAATTYFVHESSSAWNVTFEDAAKVGVLLLGASIVSANHLQRINDQVPWSGLCLRVCLALFTVFLGVLALCGVNWSFGNAWKNLSPYEDSGTAALACLLAVASGWILNLFVPYPGALKRLHQENKTDDLEKFLYDAAEENALVQITLDTGKVYTGWVASLPPDPKAKNAYVRLLPTHSGYRHPDTHEVAITTYYDPVYAELREKLTKEPTAHNIRIADFVKIFPMSCVKHVGRFEMAAHDFFIRRSATSST